MSSVSEAELMLDILTEIESRLTVLETRFTSEKIDRISDGLKAFQQLERLTLRWLAIARRMGLPEEVDAAINRVARLISTLRMLQLAMGYLASTNPLTAFIGVTGMVGAALSMSDSLVGY